MDIIIYEKYEALIFTKEIRAQIFLRNGSNSKNEDL
jgi:hypothetical protein